MNCKIRSRALMVSSWLLIILISHTGQLQAGFYKCIDAEGNTTYSQLACPTQDTTAAVLQGNSASSVKKDCRIAKNFSRQTANDMKRGISSNVLFDRYGGMDSISHTTMGIINYVYSFKSNPDASAARIANLATVRCESGSYGEPSCDKFPYSFIEERGGCEFAAGAGDPYNQPSGAYNQRTMHPSNSAPLPDAMPNSTFSQDYSPNAADRLSTCRTRIQLQIKKVNERMRGRLSASEQNSLREKRNRLGDQLSDC